MIKTLNIENVGNIKSLSVELGKVNVFIGPNLAGQDIIAEYIHSNYPCNSTLYRTLLTPLSPENQSIIKDKLIEWFHPIVKDFKEVGQGGWHWQNAYDNKWYGSHSVNEVVESLYSVLSNELGSIVTWSGFGAFLNPRLARKLFSEMIEISENNNKQIIVFTNQPSILDALDLDAGDHRLFTVGFWRDASCRVIGIDAPMPLEGQEPVPLSEAWLQGFIGGLPKGF